MMHADEDLLRRFLVDQASEEERERIEARMFADDEFFESLRALEHEMLVMLVRRELPARWAMPLTAAIAASPARQNRLDDVRQLVRTIVQPPPAAAPVVAHRRSFRAWLPAAAAVVVAVGAAGWLSRQPPAGEAPSAPAAQVPAAPPTFILPPGPTRSADQAAHVLDWRGAAATVKLVAVLDVPVASPVSVSMRPVGGAALDLPARTETRPIPGGVEVSWELNTATVPPGDYLMSYTAGSPPVTVGSRFARIVK